MKRLRAAALILPALLGSCVAPTSGGRPAAPPATSPAATPPSQPPSAAIRISAAEPATAILQLTGTVQQGALLHGQAAVPLTWLALDGEPIPVAPDGAFLIGFGRDAGPRAILSGVTADGQVVTVPLTVAPRQWDVQSLPTLAKGTPSTPEQIERRKTELAQIVAARQVHPVTEGWRQQFIWPVTGRISTLFGSQRIYAGEPGDPHSGIDIARPQGTPVAAPAEGVVVLAAAAPFSLEGNLLMIDHGMGLTSAFLHLSHIDVKVGDRVTQGQLIGEVGMTGRATGPHLHWGLVWQGRRIDPLLWAGPMPGG